VEAGGEDVRGAPYENVAAVGGRLTRLFHRVGWTGWIGFATFAYLGLPYAGIGVAWPSLREVFHQPLAGLGAVLLALNAGGLAANAAVGPLARRYGSGAVLLAGGICGTLGLACWTVAPTWTLFIAGSAAVGAMDSLFSAGVSAHIALTRGAGMMNVAHGTFAAGAALSPGVVVWMLTVTGSPRAFFEVCVLCQAVLTAVFAATLRRWRVTAPEASAAPAALSRRAVLLAALAAFFLYLGAEQLCAQWSFSMLLAGGTSATAGTAAVAGFWAAFAGGRFLAGALVGRLKTARVLTAGVAVAAAGSLVLLASPVGLPMLGLGLAPLFPTMIAWVPVRFGPRAAAAVTGALQAAASIGSGGIPAASGLLFQWAGLRLLPGVILLCLVGLAAVLVAGGIGREFPRPAGSLSLRA
jgi:MFS family permease